ncbi:hypothetical protein DA718_00535 [Klebsiella huaxiensis]|uniref:Fimbria/pilus periplasmic chaperone n=2 Tax=Klebsiella huaxiensis TaxID=2153354 RepID=A0A564KJR2_9ENTR|nr:fimbria/pilus periplasmic chaperone [Klebsiella huaxiensis]MDG1640323.1 fimbria/pilus periplasmic chaperone [Klebsiella huaxiensis]QBG05766.1 hypothetical protein DA718_00535 [Klebsiella huaxiensis]VUS69473.1 putative fimbrial chaperone YadV [Klebsiella huaxiensis]VUS97939.1 putative fimbrial chaperone YadV [Klebsiella huaxiensis]
MRNFRLWLIFSKWHIACLLCLAIFQSCQMAQAVVNAEATRVIIHSGEKTGSLALSNSEQQPMLVQVWVDEGDPLTPPEKVITPVIVTPPVFRMQPGEVRAIRLLISSREGLSQDKESLYWLNIYQIPPMKPEDKAQQHKVVLPLRIRMKLFIRPEGVPSPTEKEGARLGFRFDEQRKQLQVTNPTVWHLTLTNLKCGNYSAETVMIAPESTILLDLNGAVGTCSTVNYELINDEGNRWSYQRHAAN